MLRTALALLALALPATLGSQSTAPFTESSVAAASAPRAGAREELARLVPKDASILVQIQSGDALFASAKAVAESLGEPLPVPSAGAMLDLALAEAITSAGVDTTRPLALAISFDASTMAMQRTYVVPTAKAAELAARANPPFQGVAAGDYLVLTQVAGYSVSDAPSAFALDLPKAALSARVDMKKLVATFKPLIDPMLEQVQEAAAQGAQAASTGVDMSEMMDTYFEGVRDFLASAETLDLGWSQNGSSLALNGKFTVIAGSPLAACTKREPSGLQRLAAFIDPADPIVLLQGRDFAGDAALFESMTPGILGLYPESIRGALQGLFESVAKIYPQMGSAIAMSGGFGPAGVHFRSYMLPKDPAKFLAAWNEMAQDERLAELGLAWSAPQAVKVGDIEATRLRMTVDGAKIKALMATAAVPPDAQLDALLEKVFGAEGLSMTYAVQGDVLAMAMGGDEAYAQAAIGALATKKPSAEFERALANLGNANPCLLAHVDVGAALAGVADMLALVGVVDAAKKPVFPGASLSFFGAAEGLVWRGGANIDLEGLKGAVEAAEKCFPPRPGMVHAGPGARKK